VQILSEHLKEAIRTLKDMIFSFSISDADFDKEKQVVIQEIYRYQDNTLERVKIESLMQALGPCSYAFDILGTVSNIKSFTIDEVYNFYKKFYTPSNTVVSITGKGIGAWHAPKYVEDD
jgi:predicted Zn-dependent peptidase